MNSQVPPSTVANSGAALKPDRGSPPPPYNKQGMQTGMFISPPISLGLA